MTGQSLPGIAATPVVYDFRLVQSQAALPLVAAYAEIVGDGEVPAKGIGPEVLKASLGPAPGKISRIIPFEDSGEGIGYVLMVDVSKSLSATQFLVMKETIAAFVDAMSKADQAALVTFGSTVNTLQDFSLDRSKIKEKLAALQLTDDETAFYSGIDKGITVAKAIGEGVPRRRVLITLTDGVNDISGGIGKDDIFTRLATDPVPLYLIGFVQGKPTLQEDSAIGVMKQLARISGGRYYDGRNGEWRGIYFAITRAIRSAFLIEIDVPNFHSEGNVYGLEISLTSANREWKEKMQLTVPAGGTKAVADNNVKPGPPAAVGSGVFGGNGILYAGVGTAVLIALCAWFLWRRRAGKIVSPDMTAGIMSEAKLESTATPKGVLVRLTRLPEDSSFSPMELEILDRVILGSDPKFSNLVLEDDTLIAPAHCEFVFNGGRLFINNVAPAQDTLVNGTAIAGSHCVEEEDILQIGATELRIAFPA